MNKYKYLLKNLGLLTISNFGTKILSFVLIPLYTSILSTSEYGTYDVYSTTVSLLIPIFTLNIVEAVMRFTLDEKYNSSEVLSIGIAGVVRAILIFSLINIVNLSFGIIPIFTQYALYFELLYCGSLIYDLLIQFARGVEKVADVAIAGAMNSFVMLSCNVFFLVIVKIGLSGYFLANCLAYFVPAIYLFFKLHIWEHIVFKKPGITSKEMYSYSRPLVFNTIAWWINNVSDRYIVTWICGVAANGVYSVAYKIPSVLNIFQSIFSQAWTLSAVKEYEGNSGEFYSEIYKAYNCAMVLVCSALVCLDKLIAKVLFASEFYNAWKYAPFLMLSVVFGSLSGLLGGIFSAAKKSDVFAKTTMMGASINTCLNIVLVYKFGPVGAAISTLISYFVVWIARLIEAKKITSVNVPVGIHMISYLIVLIQSCVWVFVANDIRAYCIEIVLFCFVMIIYSKDIISLVKRIFCREK